jgi:hypothetical protein
VPVTMFEIFVNFTPLACNRGARYLIYFRFPIKKEVLKKNKKEIAGIFTGRNRHKSEEIAYMNKNYVRHISCVDILNKVTYVKCNVMVNLMVKYKSL